MLASGLKRLRNDPQANAIACLREVRVVGMGWLVADPQKPQYKKHWCPKCKAHSEYVKKRVQRGSGDHIRTETVYNCVDCNKHMYVPRDYKLSNQGITVGRLCVYFTVALIGIFWLGLVLKRGREEWAMLISGMVGLVFIGIPAGIAIWSTVKHANWVRWAKDRGWEEND